MTTIAALRKQIAELREAMNPRGSLQWKLRQLDRHDRVMYDAWRDECDEFRASFGDDHDAYVQAIMAVDSDQPEMPYSLSVRLYGPPPVITSDNVAELYRNMIESGL